VARVTSNDAPSPNVQVRGVSEKKAAIDVLEYFDENIVPKAQVLKRSLTVALNVTQVSGVRGVSDAVFNAASASLAEYDTRDVEKRARADAKNAVESYCYDMKEKLYDEALEAVTLESERDEFRALLSDASDWLDVEGSSATTKAFQDKLASLRKFGDEFTQRLREIVEAPKLAEEMRTVVDGAKEILANITSTHSVTQEEASGALTMATEALEWLEKTEKAQAALKAHEKRVLTVATIQEAFGKFERRLKSLLKRPKKAKKKAATKKASKKDDKEKKAADADAEEKADADADADAE
jgi:heat shock protein 4